MITLITGAPGSGKSAALVSMLQELSRDRPLYVNGIPDLKIAHVELEEPERWPEVVPDGAVIVIDEVQRIWRPRGAAQKVPPHVALLETHRHRGLDFYIVTQGPNLVDSNVRALVGRHVHLRELGVLGRWWYEWPETADNCRTAWRNAPIKKRYRLPKKIFGQYKSASVHIKPVRSVPWMLAVLALALGATGGLAWLAYGKINDRMHPGGVQAATSAAPTGAPVASLSSAPGRPSPGVGASVPDERVDFMPRLADRPWTAPAYDRLRTVVRMPVIAGGICAGERCVCVDETGARLDVSASACRGWIAARPFDPYTAPPPKSVDRGVGAASGSTAPPQDQTGLHPPGSSTVPVPTAWTNPGADAKPSPAVPKPSPVLQRQSMGDVPPIAPSLQSPWRRS